jgi:FkbM family methyltransferase
MKFYYGYDTDHYMDITHLVFTKCVSNNIIYIPINDSARCALLGVDPYPGILKHIVIFDEKTGENIYYAANREIKIDLTPIINEAKINPKLWWNSMGKFIDDPVEKLNVLHTLLNLEGGSFKDEYPEQLLSIKYIKENAKVLEIGGNIGRNSLIIATILNNTNNLVILESRSDIALELNKNLLLNNYKVQVESSALSENRLIQRGWVTSVYNEDTLPEGWSEVKTINYSSFLSKYNIQFDTIVADCEGALYHILKDTPNILNNIKMIIMENDYINFDHKLEIDNILNSNNFKRIYHEAGGWGPCYDFFYEVWERE